MEHFGTVQFVGMPPPKGTPQRPSPPSIGPDSDSAGCLQVLVCTGSSSGTGSPSGSPPQPVHAATPDASSVVVPNAARIPQPPAPNPFGGTQPSPSPLAGLPVALACATPTSPNSPLRPLGASSAAPKLVPLRGHTDPQLSASFSPVAPRRVPVAIPTPSPVIVSHAAHSPQPPATNPFGGTQPTAFQSLRPLSLAPSPPRASLPRQVQAKKEANRARDVAFQGKQQPHSPELVAW